MCGIFGYIGTTSDASTIILKGLKGLEYRGYDSWGIGLKRDDHTVCIEKHVGKIGQAKPPHVKSNIGIGHTRWATHGGVTQKNAHPHVSCDGSVMIVHNGIVENFHHLKSELVKKGHHFESETDSEVLAHEIEELGKTFKNKKTLIRKLWTRINGMNAIIAFFPESEEIYVIKNGSPIVLGHQKNDYFFASDASVLSSYTSLVYFLKDDEMCIISKDGFTLFDPNGQEVKPAYSTLSFAPEDAEKGQYEHFMLKEIGEQPDILQRIIRTQKDAIETASKHIQSAYGTYLIGCGTAAFACLAGTYLFSKISRRHINYSIGSEFSYLIDFLQKNSLVFALSQSGETIDTISSIKMAKENGVTLMSLTNAEGSTLYRMCDFNMLLHAGPEKAVASTKAYTAKIAFLYLIAHHIAKSEEEGIIHLQEAAREAERLFSEKESLRKIAKKIHRAKNIFVLGRGVSYAAALESALKIKEVSYIHAEGFAAGELKHGVIALIEKGTPVILFNPEDETYEDTLSAAYEVRARGAYVIGVSSRDNEVFDSFIRVKNCNDATIIPHVVVAQLMGYYLALACGHDPDMPRNLAKSVTVK